MKYKSLPLIAAACGITLLTGCDGFQGGTYTLGDMVNGVVKMTTAPSSQTTARSQNTTNTTELGAYLQPMLEGCSGIDIDKLIQEQRSVIVDIQREEDPESEVADTVTRVSFKNATAFGYPLSKIDRLVGYEEGHTYLYFNTDQFVNLRPAFKVPYYEGDVDQIIRNDINGYQYREGAYSRKLVFDRQKRMIACNYQDDLSYRKTS